MPARSAGLSSRAAAARSPPHRGAAGTAAFGARAAVQPGGAAQPLQLAAPAGAAAPVCRHRRGEQRTAGRGRACGRVSSRRAGGLGAGRRHAGRCRALRRSSRAGATNAGVWPASMRAMSQPDEPTEPLAAAARTPASSRDVQPDPVIVDPPRSRPAPAGRAPQSRGGGTLAFALILSLLALAAAAWVGWQQWQQQRGSNADRQGVAALQQRAEGIESRVGALADQRASLDQRLADAAAVNRSLREELLGQAERTRNLEDAVAKLAEKSLSGHDAMLLDETESLLRMASERYTLFHDAQGAAAAYALADQTLAAVNDGAFSGLRQSIGAEREALAKSQPASQASALQRLTELRGELDRLPLKPLDAADGAQVNDAWSRIGRALAHVVSVQRDNGAPLAVADARFARELAALDLRSEERRVG